MQLRYIENGTALQIGEISKPPGQGRIFDTVFYDLDTFTTFWAESEDLYNSFSHMNSETRLRITYFRDNQEFVLVGAPKTVKCQYNSYLTLIEQASAIEVLSRREFHRDEIRMEAKVYGLTEASLHSGSPCKASEEAEFVSEVFDISAGGLCLVSNKELLSEYDPYFMLEFSFGIKEHFLLPAKLVRKGNCAQTILFKRDYGFAFQFNHAPAEQNRLSIALFNAKLNRLV